MEQLLRERKELEQKAEDAATAAASTAAVSVIHAGALQHGPGAKPSELDERILVLQQELAREQAERRKIHNTLVDLRGNVSEIPV